MKKNIFTPLNLVLSSLKMASATLVSRLLGLVREQVMAFYFGASGITDAFLVAYRIPNLMRDLFAEGAFSSAFVPVFTRKIQRDREGARRLLWSLFAALLLVTGAISGMIVWAAPNLVEIFAPQFSLNPKKLSLTVLMVRIMAPFFTLVSLAALFMGALNSLKIFFLPSISPALLNVTMILSMVVGNGVALKWGSSQHPIIILAMGVSLGGFFQALVQFPLLLSRGMGPTLFLSFSREVGEVFRKLGPGFIGFAVTQINLIINTALATSVGVGAVSWLSFAFRLFQFPVGIVGVSVANSNLVLFSEAWHRGQRELALMTLGQALRFSLFFLLPFAAVLSVLAVGLVQIVFERGEFSLEDSMMTARALRIYALSLPFYGLCKVFVPVFYAIGREKVPVIASILSILANITFCVLLTPRYGFEVLAWGMGGSMMLNAIILGAALRSQFNHSLRSCFPWILVKMLLAAILCAGVMVVSQVQLDPTSLTLGRKILALATCGILGMGAYFLALFVMGERIKKFFS